MFIAYNASGNSTAPGLSKRERHTFMTEPRFEHNAAKSWAFGVKEDMKGGAGGPR